MSSFGANVDVAAKEDRDKAEVGLIDLALLVAENMFTLIGIPIASGLLALGISFLVSPVYTATARILPPSQQQSASAMLAAQLGSLAALAGGALPIKNVADEYVALLKSRTVTDTIVQRFNLREEYGERYIEDTRREFEKRVKITAGVKDGLISIEAEDKDPKRAAAIANGLVDEVRNLSKVLAITEAGQRRIFFEAQLLRAKEDLTRAELALRSSGVGEAVMKAIPQSAIEALARLKAQITAQEIRLASMRTYMTDANPELRLGIEELGALRAQLAKAEQNEPAKANAMGAEYIAKYRDFKYHETLFELMTKQYELARLDEAREGAIIQVVDPAVPPEKRTRPKPALVATLTALAVFFVMLLAVFGRAALKRMAEQPQSAEKLHRLRRLLHLRGA